MTKVEEDVANPLQFRRLDPRVRLLWWCTGVIGLFPPLLATMLLEWLVEPPGPTGLATGTVLVVGAILVAVLPVLRYRRWGFALRAHELWIRQGVFWVTVSVIPYGRLQFVDTRQGPLDRLFGLSQLVVHTAAVGTSGRLPGLATDQAESLRERLAAVEPDDAGV